MRTTSEGRVLRKTSALALVIVSCFLLASSMIPATAGQDDQPMPTPTPTLAPPGDSSVDNEPEALQIQVAPSSGMTTQDHLQALSSPTVLETIYVPADGSVVRATTPLAQGVVYTLRVSGTWVWGGCDPFYCPGGGPDYIRWGDAGFLTDDHFHGFSAPFWSGFIYLEVNGGRPDFGPYYHENHIYNIQVTGDGSQPVFRIQDCAPCYVDNAVALRVEIIEGTDGGASALNVKPFLQRSHPRGVWQWGEDMYGEAENLDKCGTQGPPRLCASGCYLTSWAMVVDHWGFRYNFHTNPRELNKWLCEHKGYKGLSVIPVQIKRPHSREK